MARITTLYLDDTARVSRMSAPVPDPKHGQQAAALAAAREAATEAATEAAWEAWETETFPTLTR
jgi:hypothetical protein